MTQIATINEEESLKNSIRCDVWDLCIHISLFTIVPHITFVISKHPFRSDFLKLIWLAPFSRFVAKMENNTSIFVSAVRPIYRCTWIKFGGQQVISSVVREIMVVMMIAWWVISDRHDNGVDETLLAWDKLSLRWSVSREPLTLWGRDEMNNISQTTFSNVFSSMKMFEFRLKFHWSLFPGVQLTIFQQWFR